MVTNNLMKIQWLLSPHSMEIRNTSFYKEQECSRDDRESYLVINTAISKLSGSKRREPY